MDLHQFTSSLVSQTETLLQHARTSLAELKQAAERPENSKGSVLLLFQLAHLENTLALLGDVALGHEEVVSGMLRTAAALADMGKISAVAADQLLTPAYDTLGEMYVSAAMAQAD